MQWVPMGLIPNHTLETATERSETLIPGLQPKQLCCNWSEEQGDRESSSHDSKMKQVSELLSCAMHVVWLNLGLLVAL